MDARAKAVDVMYEENSPALGWFAESNSIPLEMARRMRTFYPKAMLDPGALSGIQQMLDEAVLLKFMPRHLTAQELAEVVQPLPPRR